MQWCCHPKGFARGDRCKPGQEITMRDVMIQNSLGPIQGTLAQQPNVEGAEDGDFGKMVARAIDDVNGQLAQAGKSVEALTTGENKDIHATMISMEKASISLQLLTQVRNKIIDAYKEVQRMSF
jgi:flagellar hook-basal body complex protein FliE